MSSKRYHRCEIAGSKTGKLIRLFEISKQYDVIICIHSTGVCNAYFNYFRLYRNNRRGVRIPRSFHVHYTGLFCGQRSDLLFSG